MDVAKIPEESNIVHSLLHVPEAAMACGGRAHFKSSSPQDLDHLLMWQMVLLVTDDQLKNGVYYSDCILITIILFRTRFADSSVSR